MASRKRFAFTLIELLVVIAIIAILAVVVVLTLNPAQLLAQSRDANRLSDLSTMNSAVNLYNVDQAGTAGYSLGIASTTYISVFDPSATSSVSTICGSMGLPATSTGWSYHCAASSTFRNTNAQGWLPVNFSLISSGAPFGSLPVDPANNTSSLLYYTYQTNGTQDEITVPLESQKYLKSNLLVSNTDPSRVAIGTNPSLISQEEGLVGYWTLDEGGGGPANDQSGNGNPGTWTGTPAGTNGYYTAGKVGPWGGYFNGTSDYIPLPTNTFTANATQSFTMAMWENSTAGGIMLGARIGYNIIGISPTIFQIYDGTHIVNAGPSTGTFTDGNWHYIVGVVNRSNQTMSYYADGLPNGTPANISTVGSLAAAGNLNIGSQVNGIMYLFAGSLDDVRVYNRALSAAEIQAIYLSEK